MTCSLYTSVASSDVFRYYIGPAKPMRSRPCQYHRAYILAGATLAAVAASVWKKLALQRKRQSPEGETTSIAVLNIIFDLLAAAYLSL